MTPQEIVNFVAEALRKQGRPAVNEQGACALRGAGATKCALGWLIPDEDYSPAVEKLSSLEDYIEDDKWANEVFLLEDFRRDFDMLSKTIGHIPTEEDFEIIYYLQRSHDLCQKEPDFYPTFVARFNTTRIGRRYPIGKTPE